MSHPSWCACTEQPGADHMSRIMPVQVSRTDLVGVRIFVWQPADVPYACVELTVDEQPVTYVLPVDQAQALSRGLYILLQGI